MLTIIETPTFQRIWPAYWTEEERAEFAAYLSHYPEAGDVVKGSGGVRKVRWARQGGVGGTASYPARIIVIGTEPENLHLGLHHGGGAARLLHGTRT